MDYRDIAEKIYSLVGKKNNIVLMTKMCLWVLLLPDELHILCLL